MYEPTAYAERSMHVHIFQPEQQPGAPAILIPAPQRPLGRHIGTAPGFETAIDEARRIGCTAAQIFPGNPKGWRHVPLAPDRAATVRHAWAEAGVRPLVIHAPYIINLASPDDA